MPRKKKNIETTIEEITGVEYEEIEETFPSPQVEISGSYPTLQRKETGLASLDYALHHRGDFGLPLRNIVEIYGYVGVGKSTLSYFLAGTVTGKGNISVCDIEMLDREYVKYAAGAFTDFKGTIKMSDGTDDKKNYIPHEKMMDEMVKHLADEEYGASVLDSVSAIQPISESQGDFGEAHMGKRAKLVAQMSRALSSILRNKERPSESFVINHVYQNLGSRGHTTAGGEVLKALAGIRMMLWTGETFYDDKNEKPLGFLVKGQVEKLRFGGKGGKFQFYIVPGLGVHPGVSAMFDCFEWGLAERSARVKINDRSVGYLKADLLAYALEGKTRKFLPFIEAAQTYLHGDKIDE